MSSTDVASQRLEALTPEQESLLAPVRDEWLRIGLATGPADRPAAEEGVCHAYHAAGLPAPCRLVWVGSPVAGAITASMLCAFELSDHVPNRYWGTVREQLQDQLRASTWVQPSLGLFPADEGRAAGRFGIPIGAPVGQRIVQPVRSALLSDDRLGGSASASLRRLVEGPVARRVSRQLAWRLHELIRQAIEPVLRPFFLEDGPLFVENDGFDDDLDPDLPWPSTCAEGQHDAERLARGAALRAILPGALDNQGLDGLVRVARSAGWWWPFEHLVILTERPSALRQDAEGIVYPDGLALWAWHGVVVPEQVIERPERLTVLQIRSEPSVEVREVMLERYGTDRYIRNGGAERVSEDDVGTLWSVPLGDERLVVVEVRNSTPEPDGSYTTYWLRVPPEVRTAREAVAWTFGLTADDYRPTIET